MYVGEHSRHATSPHRPSCVSSPHLSVPGCKAAQQPPPAFPLTPSTSSLWPLTQQLKIVAGLPARRCPPRPSCATRTDTQTPCHIQPPRRLLAPPCLPDPTLQREDGTAYWLGLGHLKSLAGSFIITAGKFGRQRNFFESLK